jgi:exopolysaccharide biosynthesis polyprenyl glycosylphosphotransferase
MGSRRSTTSFLKTLDLLIAAAWFVLLLLMTAPELESRSVDQFLAIRFSVGNILLFIALMALWHLSMATSGVYKLSPSKSAYHQTLNIIKGTTIGVALWLLAGATFELSFARADFLLQLWCGVTALYIMSRLLVRLLLRRRKQLERYQRRLLIVGINPRAIRIARDLENHPELGYRVLGIADEASMDCYPLEARLDELPDYLRRTAVDEVIVCLPVKSLYDRVVEIIGACEAQGITVRVAADLFPCNESHSSIERFGENELISIHPHTISTASARAKRVIDITVSGVLLCLLLPVLVLVALVIKLASAGPVFFTQDRLGLNKKIIRMLKFRTMVQGAADQQAELEDLNEASGPVFKIRDDPRVTPVGKFLRRTSIDELPQLINVLMGEMSLVGPRPLPVRDYEGFSEDWHRRRFSVQPGISGLWQVAGRSDLPFEQWMELDLQYINEWSLLLDFKVLLKTIPAVLRGTGAT